MIHPSTSLLDAHPVRSQLRTSAIILSVLSTLAGAPAFAASPFEGRYQGRGEGQLSLQVFKLDDGSEAHFVLAETARANQCTGDLRGLARPSGPTTLVLHKTDPDAEESCRLTLRFSPDHTQVRMEATSCSNYHGMACAFDGSPKRR